MKCFLLFRPSIHRVPVRPSLSRSSTTMEKSDIAKLEKTKLPSRKVSQDVSVVARPALLRSNTVLGGNIKLNKAGRRGYLCRWTQSVCVTVQFLLIFSPGPAIKLSTRR